MKLLTIILEFNDNVNDNKIKSNEVIKEIMRWYLLIKVIIIIMKLLIIIKKPDNVHYKV